VERFPSFADCLYTAQDKQLVPSGNYFTDASAGTLPNVSFVMPTGSGDAVYSQHNGQYNSAGDNWIGKVVSAAMTGPEASSTAVIVTYDDCGCFYDQLPPPAAPDGRQMGPGVPFVIVSQYSIPSHTDSTVTSSTGSILAFINWDFTLPALGLNDANADNLSADFDFAQPPLAFPTMARQHLLPAAYRLLPSTAHDAT
jgi:phospholipase C